MRPRSTSRLRYQLLAVGLGPALALGIGSAAHGDRGRYVVRSFAEPVNPGLEVSKPLEEFRAISRARVVVPTEWRRLNARSGQLRFITPQVSAGGSCRYRVMFSVRSRLAPPRDAGDYVADALPPPAQMRLFDKGERGRSAFRVTRARGGGPIVRLRAFWAAVLTRRHDIAPAGQVAWSEISATAASRRGDECHSGTWRAVLGPQLGDALATARTRLDFVRRRS
jgi:hypothetical protein